MNIQKSRLAAMLTVMLMVCMMVSMFAVTVSADETNNFECFPVEDFDIQSKGEYANIVYYLCPNSDVKVNGVAGYEEHTSLFEELNTYPYLKEAFYIPEEDIYLLQFDAINWLIDKHNEFSNHGEIQTVALSECEYRATRDGLALYPVQLAEDYGYDSEQAFNVRKLSLGGSETETTPPVTPTAPVTPDDSSDLGLTDVVTPDLFNMVLDEVVSLLPIVIPVMIGFIGLRKGISFLQSVLHSA